MTCSVHHYVPSILNCLLSKHGPDQAVSTIKLDNLLHHRYPRAWQNSQARRFTFRVNWYLGDSPPQALPLTGDTLTQWQVLPPWVPDSKRMPREWMFLKDINRIAKEHFSLSYSQMSNACILLIHNDQYDYKIMKQDKSWNLFIGNFSQCRSSALSTPWLSPEKSLLMFKGNICSLQLIALWKLTKEKWNFSL